MSHPVVVAAPRSRLRVGLGAAIVLVLVALGIAVAVATFGPHGATTVVSSTAPVRTAATVEQPVYVQLVGAVVHPGLFVLHEGDRAVDAIAAAGGFTPTADRGQLNLARPLVDGEQIYVPVIGESAPAAHDAGASGATSSGGKVNINSADETALETLPRVGPALAKRILDWRAANGRFTSVDDLMSVTGIGQKTFDGLKDLVTV